MDSERELEVIRDEMEQTRSNLADKLGALETQVRETVSTASETVSSTVEGVKEVVTNVSETVGSVTETLNFSKHVEEHPWAAMGIAVAAGFVISRLLGGSSQPIYLPHPQAPAAPPPEPAREQPQRSDHRQEQPAKQGPSLAEQAALLLPALGAFVPDLGAKASAFLPSMDKLVPEIEKLGNTVAEGLGQLAVGGVMSVVRELAVDALPDTWKGEITKIMDDLTEQLGGKPQEAKGQEKPGQNGKQHQGQGGQKEQEKKSDKDEKKGDKDEHDKQGAQRGWREARNELVGQS